MEANNQFQLNSVSTIDSFLRRFIHANEQTHNNEIDMGGDTLLFRLLLALVSDGRGHVALGVPANFSIRKRQKISKICNSMGMIYRCSKEKAEISFQRLGLDLLDLLSVVLSAELRAHSIYYDRSLHSRLRSEGQPLPNLPGSSSLNGNGSDCAIKSVTRIISSFAQCKSATRALATHSQLVTQLECIIECSRGISFESQHNALWILANVVCDKENSLFLLSTNPRLFITLSRAASNPENIIHQNTQSTWSQCYQALQLQRTALRCILNLSFVERVAEHLLPRVNTLLTSVCQLINIPTEQFRTSPRVHEIIVQIRQYSVGILYNLSNTSDAGKCLMCRLQRGVVVTSLRVAASNNRDPIVQRKATQALANLIIFNRPRVISPV